VRAGSFASLRLARDGQAISKTGTDSLVDGIRGSDSKGSGPLSFQVADAERRRRIEVEGLDSST